MLKSGDKVALFTLAREVLSYAAVPVDLMLSLFEPKGVIENSGPLPPMVLIVGGSRSGTTLVYQMLAQHMSCSYFSNLTAWFPRSPILATRLFGSGQSKASSDFRNYYGSVSGLNGPNDGFHIWNRWLGEDRNSVPERIEKEKLIAMQEFFHHWRRESGVPFLSKNNRNTLCIEQFENAFDDTVFVEIRRDPVYVVQSLICAREFVQGDKRNAWGLASSDSYSSGDQFGYIDDIVEQVWRVDSILDEAARKIDGRRYIRLRYEELCARPGDAIAAVREAVLKEKSPPISDSGLTQIRNTNRQVLPDTEFARIKKSVKKTYGKIKR